MLDVSKEVSLEVNAEKTEVHVHVSSPDYRSKSLYTRTKKKIL
jgi:hypothetical protein